MTSWHTALVQPFARTTSKKTRKPPITAYNRTITYYLLPGSSIYLSVIAYDGTRT